MPLSPRHLGRYRQIVEVLARHGFGAMLAQLDLERHLKLPGLLQRHPPEPPAPGLTPAEHVRLALEELGPTFVKMGQILSTRPDLVPPSYITEMSRLQDNVPPFPWEQVKIRVEEELGGSIEHLFIAFDPIPVAAASLAQVHFATLPGGQEVVVKVQRPGIRRTINLDLDILGDLARLAQERTSLGQIYDFAEIADDFATTLRAELDYQREGRNADRFRANFASEPYLYIPAIYWDHTTERVLTQERLTGIKFDDIAALDAAGYDRHQIALHAAHLIIKQVLEDGFFHADPHPGNIVIMEGEVIGALDFGLVGHLGPGDRAHLIRLYIVAVQFDTEGVVDQLVRMGVVDEQRLDRKAMQRDIRRLLLKYHGTPLKDIRAREVIEELTPIFYRHHFRLPTDLWLLGKTLVMMEGVGLKLAPDFDMIAVSKPYVSKFMLRLWLPTEWGPPLLRSATQWGDLLAGLPRQTAHILSDVEQGQFKLNVRLPELEQAVNHLDRIANRLIVSILLAAFILALAMLIPTLNLEWPWGLPTWIVIIGFVTVSILGLWLLLSILRSGRGF
jgi:ubiquinone biosynthesis protein